MGITSFSLVVKSLENIWQDFAGMSSIRTLLTFRVNSKTDLIDHRNSHYDLNTKRFTKTTFGICMMATT